MLAAFATGFIRARCSAGPTSFSQNIALWFSSMAVSGTATGAVA